MTARCGRDVLVVKIVFNLIAIGLLIILFVVVMIVLQLNYFGPRQHTRNTAKAESFNQTNWESGFGDIYTIEASVEASDEMRSVSMDVICVKKMITADVSLKNGTAYIRERFLDLNSTELTIPISNNYQVVFNVGTLCKRLAGYKAGQKTEYFAGQEIPFSPFHHLSVTVRRLVEPLASCTVHTKGEVFQHEALRLFPMTVLSITQEPVRDILSRKEYGPADAAHIRELGRENPSQNNVFKQSGSRYYWSYENMCWHQSSSECSSRANLMCSLYP